MPPDPAQILAQVVRALEEAEAPYLVGGSLASSRYGLPRTTQDVDLVADLREEQIGPFIHALQGDFYVDDEMIREAIRQRSSFNVIHLELAFKIDIFLVPNTPLAQLQMKRRRLITANPENSSETLYFCSPEDIILHKLDWHRQTGGISDRQWNDVLGVLKVQADALDAVYLRHWARELGLTDLLQQAIRDAVVTL